MLVIDSFFYEMKFSAIFDRLRSILSDSDIDKRIQYMIEVIFHIRKDKFQVQSINFNLLYKITKLYDTVMEWSRIIFRLRQLSYLPNFCGAFIYTYVCFWKIVVKIIHKCHLKIKSRDSSVCYTRH